MNRIKRVSLLFRVLFQIALIVIPALLAVSWATSSSANSVGGLFTLDIAPTGYPILAPLTTTTRILGFFISMIPTGINMIVLYFLIKLFRLFEQGEIFSISNVRYIRNIGYTLLIGQLLNPIYDGLMSATLTWHNHAYGGMRYASVTFDSTNIGILLISVLVILISWIMAEGCKLREEQQFTV